MSRPSDDMTLEELREEYDWIYEFQSRMAERVSRNPDVHNHVDYVNQLEAENAKLRELVRDMYKVIKERNSWWDCMSRDTKRFADRMRELEVDV